MQPLVAVFVFWQSETVVQKERGHFVMFYTTEHARVLRVFGSFVQGSQRKSRYFESGEGPGDKNCSNATFFKINLKHNLQITSFD